MSASSSPFIDLLKQKFGDAIVAFHLSATDPWVDVHPEGLVDVCTYLRDDPALRFEMLNCITAVDYFHPDPKKAAKLDGEPRMELVYHLSSISKKHTLVLKIKIPRWRNNVEGQLPEVPSVSSVWGTANWHEREVFDLSGIKFLGHPDLRRILCPEDWVGYPLRKDYEMPKEYHGIRCR